MKEKNNRVRSWIALSLCFLLLIGALYIALTGRSPSAQTHQQTLTDVGFDTFVTFSQEGTQEEFDENLAFIRERFLYYNQLFDRYQSYEGVNNLKTINDAAGDHAVVVDDALIDCLLMARTYTGYSPHFDASQGTLLEVWHTYREEGISLNETGEDGRLPEEAELQRAANAQSWDAVRIDEESSEVMIIDSDVSLDLGGIAKGYAVEQVKRELEEILDTIRQSVYPKDRSKWTAADSIVAMNRMRCILGGITDALEAIQKHPKDRKMDCFYLMMQVELALALALGGIEKDDLPRQAADDQPGLDTQSIIRLADEFQSRLRKRAEEVDSFLAK